MPRWSHVHLPIYFLFFAAPATALCSIIITFGFGGCDVEHNASSLCLRLRNAHTRWHVMRSNRIENSSQLFRPVCTRTLWYLLCIFHTCDYFMGANKPHVQMQPILILICEQSEQRIAQKRTQRMNAKNEKNKQEMFAQDERESTISFYCRKLSSKSHSIWYEFLGNGHLPSWTHTLGCRTLSVGRMTHRVANEVRAWARLSQHVL